MTNNNKYQQINLNDLFIINIFNSLNNLNKNTRYIVILIFFVSCIGFINVWNSMQRSWFNCRVKIHQNQINWYPYFNSDSIPENIEYNEVLYEDFKLAEEYYNSHNYNKEILHDVINNLNKAEIESIWLIKIPVIGSCFDINDIGVFGGVIFSFILFLYLYILFLKEKTIKIVFKVIKESKLKTKNNSALFLLALYQVLQTERKDKDNNELFKSIMGKIPDKILLLPIVVQTIIIFNDIYTFNIGTIINFKATITFIIVSGICWLFILSLTIYCFIIKRNIDNLWNKEYSNNIIEY